VSNSLNSYSEQAANVLSTSSPATEPTCNLLLHQHCDTTIPAYASFLTRQALAGSEYTRGQFQNILPAYLKV
jgi:hypothetical protein